MKLTVRGTDRWGSGDYYATRGDRHHNGVDIVVKPGQHVRPLVGGKVTKIGFPYPPSAPGGYLRYVQVTDDHGFELRYFYVMPSVIVGQHVTTESIIGVAENLTSLYEGITDHYHFEVLMNINGKKVFVNPVQFLVAVGHEVN